MAWKFKVAGHENIQGKYKKAQYYHLVTFHDHCEDASYSDLLLKGPKRSNIQSRNTLLQVTCKMFA